MSSDTASGSETPAPETDTGNNIAIDEEGRDQWIADYLLEQKLYLTALEFHAELLETGTTLETLETFFASDENFTETSDLASAVKSGDDHPYKKSAGKSQASGMLKDKDATISFLQYELRVANEDLGEARERLDELKRHGVQFSGGSGDSPSNDINEEDLALLKEGKDAGPIAGYERRLVNCLVNQYLIKHGYKLTAITFSDEVDDQDLGDVEDVGLDPATSEALELPALHRYFRKRPKKSEVELQAELDEAVRKMEEAQAAAAAAVQAQAVAEDARETAETRVEELKTSLEAEQNQVTELASALQEAHQKGAQLEKEVAVTGQKAAAAAVQALEARQAAKEAEEARKREVEESRQRAESGAVDAAEVEVARAAVMSPSRVKDADGKPPSPPPSRVLAAAKASSLSSDVVTIGDDGEELVSARIAELERDGDAVTIVASCLPFIIPNVLLNKREELLPVILCVIRQHDDPAMRDKLTHSLFNLIRKPDDNQRNVIMNGCIALARSIGALRVEEELLPQCWEQIDHKHAERRVLVAESCGALAPYVRGELRGSLLLSICLQLVDDRSPLVRAAVASNLGRIVQLVADPDKYTQLTEVCLKLLYDNDEEVSRAAQRDFVPHLADYAFTHDKLLEGLYALFLSEAKRIVTGRGPSGDDGRSFTNPEQTKLGTMFALLTNLMPFIHEAVLLSFIDKEGSDRDEQSADVSITDDDVKSSLQAKFDEQIAQGSGESRTCIDWLACDLVPGLLNLARDIDAVRDSEAEIGLNNVIRAVCQQFGNEFVNSVVDPMFGTHMSVDPAHHDTAAVSAPSLDANPFADTATQPEGVTDEEQSQALHARSRLVQPYITGVLCTLPDEKMSASITKFLTSIALEERGWSRDAHLPAFLGGIHQLCLQDENLAYSVLTIAWDQLVHPQSYMRVALAHLFDVLATVLNSDTIAKKIVPALITLASDADARVRQATIPAFTGILVKVQEAAVRDKVQATVTSLVDDSNSPVDLQCELIDALTELIPVVDDHVRETFCVPQLTTLTMNATILDDLVERAQAFTSLSPAYLAFSGCAISPDVVASHLIPGIQHLLDDQEALEDDSRAALNQMLTDLQGQGKSSAGDKGTSGGGGKKKFLSKFKKRKNKDEGDGELEGKVSFDDTDTDSTGGDAGTEKKGGKFKQRMRSFTLRKKASKDKDVSAQ